MRDVREPNFAVGDGYAVYRGPVGDSSFHRHAAFQVVIGDEVSMLDDAGQAYRGGVLVVPPMVCHRLAATPDLVTFFVEPHSGFADRLRERCGDGITGVPELADLREADIPVRPSTRLDPRLLAALAAVEDRGVPMPEIAALVGLSPQRLRALAREQVGMPLTRWRLWVGLRRAAEALWAGRSPAEAAATAGFADQAHLTRRMREMLGLTPAAVPRAASAAPGHPAAPAQRRAT
ncbi:MAG: helix-turn-helix domain-containing protein [Saccharothrix sp.]|nr:helix-turn-helix domain-containing protein [Saccharothrix sp.]